MKPYQDLENPVCKSSGEYLHEKTSETSKFSHIIPFLGTCQNPINHKLCIGYGELDINDTNKPISYSSVNTEYNKDCEKNWVFYGNYKIIYQWYPLILGTIIKKPELFFKKEKEIQMPPFFQQVRGSTNGFEFGNEIWFICHVVEYSQPREYYHFFAILDKETMKINRWSYLFKYEGEKIEYSLGLIVEEDRIIVSYSKWDSCPCIAVYNKKVVENGMFEV